MQNVRQKSAAAAAVIGMGALLVGCGSSTLARGDSAASFNAAGGAPLSVSCEPNQRAVVRQVIVNGTAAAQVECQTVAPAFAANGTVNTFGTAAYGATPVAYQPGMPTAVPVNYAPSAYEPTRIVRTTSPEPQVVTRQAAPQRVAYQRAPERTYKAKRSVTKSAVIIGSSAGVGAGIGAAVGGKKGAGIGALLGGGGAALWDQITRRQQ